MATEEMFDRSAEASARRAAEDARSREAEKAQAAAASGNGSKPQKINEEKGYETLVKQMQYFLLYVLPSVLVSANKNNHLDLDTSKRLRKLDVNDTSGNLSVSAALSRTSNIPFLRKIPPNVLSGLQPMIKVYKVRYPGGFQKKNEAIYQVPFDDNIRPIGGKDSITDILSPRPGGLDVASLVSFDYQFIGTNPAESETAITAKMKLKFLSLAALLEERQLLPYSQDKNTKNPQLPFKYADLVNQAKRDSPEYYRIKVHVGYNKVKLDYVKKLLGKGGNIYNKEGKYAEFLTRAINESNMILYIYPIAHDLSFNDNGTIDLNIEFRGAIERALVGDTSNVLLVGDEAGRLFEDSKRAKKEIERKNADLEKQKSTTGMSDAEYNRQRQDLDEQLKKEIQAMKATNSKIYSGFVKYLFKQNRIRTINFIPEAFGAGAAKKFSSATVMDTSVMRASDAAQFVVPKNTDLNYSVISDATELNKLVQIMVNQVEAAGREAAAGDAASGAGKSPGSAGFPSQLPNKINFVFFQDLITSVFEIPEIKNQLDLDDFYMLLGNMLIPTAYNYVETFISKSKDNLFLSQLATDMRGIGEVPLVQYNIGNLPISIELFNKWFVDTVVKPGKVEWKLKHFLYDVMELLRYSTMSIFGNQVAGLPSTRTLINSTTVSKELGKWIKDGERGIVSFIDKVPKNLASFDSSEKTADPREVSNVLFLYVPAIQAENINVFDADKMARDYNMFTFTVGSNVGLLKKISYKKMEIPGLREARATQEGELATGTFRMKYDSDIEMYGPCFFRPGDMVVINPVFLSKTSPTENMLTLAKDLGLGGVYMVLRTNTDISRDGMITKLETVFQSYGNLFKKNLIRPSDLDLVGAVAYSAELLNQVVKKITEENFADPTSKQAQEFEKNLLLTGLGGEKVNTDLVDAWLNEDKGEDK